jgi:hypothetical protein
LPVTGVSATATASIEARTARYFILIAVDVIEVEMRRIDSNAIVVGL